MRILVIITIFLLLTAVMLPAQSDITAVTESLTPLPGGFGSIELGMDIETVKEKLFADPNFNYRGEPDVSMRPAGKQTVIDCDGAVYVDRGYFQFDEDKLYLITMVLDSEYVDHYSIYTAFTKKYGEPVSLNPSRTIWEDENVTISLERPLSIKYIDRGVFKKLQEQSSSESTIESQLRQDFIDSF